MTSTSRSRQPRGIPVGGQFSADRKGEPTGTLNGAPAAPKERSPRRVFTERQATMRMTALMEGRNVAPRCIRNTHEFETSTATRKDWWDNSRVIAPQSSDKAKVKVPLMTDNNTPSKLAGRANEGHALSGELRTYRRTYEFDDVSVKMPSVAAINREAKLRKNATFDVPVESTYEGGKVMGIVRVTKGPGNTWECESLGFGDHDSFKVQEAVQASLEARRPSMTRQDIGSIEKRRRERVIREGGPFFKARSGWIDAVTYSRDTATMVTKTRADGDQPSRVYGHRVSFEVYKELMTANAPGQVYNQKVRGSATVPAGQCGKCGRAYFPQKGHTCPRPDNAIPQKKSVLTGDDVTYRDRAKASAYNALVSGVAHSQRS